MDQFLMYAGIGLLFFLVFSLDNVVETYMKYKLKIAEANRDAEKYRAEAARTTSTQ